MVYSFDAYSKALINTNPAKMPIALKLAGGIIPDRLDYAEGDQYRALERAVLASEAKRQGGGAGTSSQHGSNA